MRVKFLSVATAAAATLAVSLVGCTGDSSFEDDLREAASDPPFTLPSEPTKGATFSQVAVLCPYADVPESASESIHQAAEGIDTDSDDGVQWLIFDTDQGTKTLKLSLESWDFCSVDDDGGVYAQKQKWTASEDGDVTAVRPAD